MHIICAEYLEGNCVSSSFKIFQLFIIILFAYEDESVNHYQHCKLTWVSVTHGMNLLYEDWQTEKWYVCCYGYVFKSWLLQHSACLVIFYILWYTICLSMNPFSWLWFLSKLVFEFAELSSVSRIVIWELFLCINSSLQQKKPFSLKFGLKML